MFDENVDIAGMYVYFKKNTRTLALWNVDVAIPRYKSALCVWSQNLRYQIAKKEPLWKSV